MSIFSLKREQKESDSVNEKLKLRIKYEEACNSPVKKTVLSILLGEKNLTAINWNERYNEVVGEDESRKFNIFMRHIESLGDLVVRANEKQFRKNRTTKYIINPLLPAIIKSKNPKIYINTTIPSLVLVVSGLFLVLLYTSDEFLVYTKWYVSIMLVSSIVFLALANRNLIYEN